MTDPAPVQPSEEVWTTRRLLGWMVPHFEARGVESPRIVAEMLLAHVLGVERLKLYMDPDRPTSEIERATFRQLVERAAFANLPWRGSLSPLVAGNASSHIA